MNFLERLRRLRLRLRVLEDRELLEEEELFLETLLLDLRRRFLFTFVGLRLRLLRLLLEQLFEHFRLFFVELAAEEADRTDEDPSESRNCFGGAMPRHRRSLLP